MTNEAKKELISRYYLEIMACRRYELFSQLFAQDFKARYSNGQAVGLLRYEELLKGSHAAFPDLKVTIEDQIAEGDKVATRWTAAGTQAGEYLGVAPTGKRVVLTAIHIHRIENDRIAELWEEINLYNILKSLGAVQ